MPLQPGASGAHPGREPSAELPFRVAALLIWFASFAVYAVTAYRTIAWWDSSEYSLAAASLGVAHAPGSLLLTILGWSILHVPTGLSAAHQLNLFAGALAATAVTLAFASCVRLMRMTAQVGGTQDLLASRLMLAAAGAGVLVLAFSSAFWTYAVQFTPYILSCVLTALMLLTMLHWWDRSADSNAWRWLFLLALLFGLDYSVHRTNALLIPGALVWVLIRRPATLGSFKSWAAASGGLAAGLAVQFLIIPISRAHPVLNAGNPDTWSRFWDYESLAQMGGGFLVSFYPRHAPLGSSQAMDFVRSFGSNFAWTPGAWGVLGILVPIFSATGWVALWRRDRRLAAAFGAVLLLQAVMTVAFFNIPAHFFRTFERHYLPVFVTWAIVVAYGAAALIGWLYTLLTRRRVRWAFVVVLLPLLPSIGALDRNWRHVDGSNRAFARDFAVNLLSGLPQRAILFTYGDNDTYPLWYEQAVEHVRADVHVVNFSLLNADWYVSEVIREDRDFPLPRDWSVPPMTVPWRDTTITLATPEQVAGNGRATGNDVARSIDVRIAPSWDSTITRGEFVFVEMLRSNEWRRPLAVAVYAAYPGLPGLAPYARTDGLFTQIMPQKDPPIDREALRKTLLESYTYAGYADAAVPLDVADVAIGLNYYEPLQQLLAADQKAGDEARCSATRDAMLQRLPLDRLQAPPETRKALESACRGVVTAHN
jgi:hypothetical protein